MAIWRIGYDDMIHWTINMKMLRMQSERNSGAEEKLWTSGCTRFSLFEFDVPLCPSLLPAHPPSPGGIAPLLFVVRGIHNRNSLSLCIRRDHTTWRPAQLYFRTIFVEPIWPKGPGRLGFEHSDQRKSAVTIARLICCVQDPLAARAHKKHDPPYCHNILIHMQCRRTSIGKYAPTETSHGDAVADTHSHFAFALEIYPHNGCDNQPPDIRTHPLHGVSHKSLLTAPTGADDARPKSLLLLLAFGSTLCSGHDAPSKIAGKIKMYISNQSTPERRQRRHRWRQQRPFSPSPEPSTREH